ncbi:MAG: RraA family protein, partial [Ilumatobacteraceae bacterium]|nr:RraA family protein [Ilumatobacteraceae bacterium]
MTSTSAASGPNSDLLERLRHVDTASLSDANKALHVLPPAIRPLVPGVRMAGRAVTAVANGDLMSVIGALEIGGAGDVLVVSAGAFDQAVSGELFGTEAFRRGMSGVVIDGLSRDSAALRKLGMPFYSRGITPKAPPAMSVPEIQVPLLIGDIEVLPGDILVGDDDGIIVGTVAEFEAIVDAAEAFKRARRRCESRSRTAIHCSTRSTS